MIKENINLGDNKKFVPYKSNGVTNCLELCKAILKNYGMTSYGSSNNVFKLMHEKNGKLIPYGDDVKNNYHNAIECIDRHLEHKRPIIVGVNHTLNNKYNEGATDHFVVIYGRGYDNDNECYYYNYYEVGKTDINSGCNDELNRFIFVDGDVPQLYDKKSQRTNGDRFDVTQVRPNDGILDGTISQNSY